MNSRSASNQNWHPVVFPVSAAFIALFVFMGVFATDFMNDLYSSLHQNIVESFGWFYVLSMACFLVFAIWLAFSRFGHIRLGGDDVRPDFHYLTWFAMLFSAGMGIGLVFYGVAEPIFHFASPPGVRGADLAEAQNAMGLTFFHWGLHPWAVYAIVALALAYFGFRWKLPLTIRSVFYPILGERIHGWIGDVIDIFALVSTMFGVATSLGLGTLQISAGLNYVAGIEEGVALSVVIIAIITAIATVSVVTGISVGIRRLSEFNISLAGLLMLFVFIVGPTVFLLNSFVENIGAYLQALPTNTFWTGSFLETRREWLGSWTVFYWAWWIAWSPFVGMFIARVSRGRTIREFIIGVLAVPTIGGFAWLTVFGSTSLYFEIFNGAGITEAVNDNAAIGLFVLLEQFPLTTITAIAAIVCITIFFVTSSDSASYVIDMISNGGNPNPSVGNRIFWAVTEGVVAAVLLVGGGETALAALQTASITSALPFTIILLVLCYSLVRGLSQEKTVAKSS